MRLCRLLFVSCIRVIPIHSKHHIKLNPYRANTMYRNILTTTTTFVPMEPSILIEKCPHDIFINMINIQKQKETAQDIWKNSPYKDLVKLQSNNVGNVGETFVQQLCDNANIPATVDGTKTKQHGGGNGDGTIHGKCVEIKTSHRGCVYPNFQHELGETPWKPEYMLFVDIAPECIYFTLFPNYNEEFYKSGKKCVPYFPTKAITWRKGTGAFKLDTTVKINEDNVSNGYTLKINESTTITDIANYMEKLLLSVKNMPNYVASLELPATSNMEENSLVQTNPIEIHNIV